jgi:ribonuclease Y
MPPLRPPGPARETSAELAGREIQESPFALPVASRALDGIAKRVAALSVARALINRIALQFLEPMDVAGWPEGLAMAAFGGGMVLGFAASWLVARHRRRRARLEAASVLELAKREAGVARQETLGQASLEIERRKVEAERELSRREMELEGKLRAIRSHEQSLGELDSELGRREERLQREQSAVRQAREALRAMSKSVRQTMAKLAAMDVDQVRAALRDDVRQECQDELRALRRETLERTEREIQDEARRIVVAAMQRLACKPSNDLAATIVALPNDDMKGRIIGREGRNIKCFEAATGTTLLIDESPQTVLISSFDPVRRQIAKAALERLVADGRIHPASIEEFVKQAQAEVDSSVREAGEAAVERLKLAGVHPEVVDLLGRLAFRFSYNQNVLDHSVEVAMLCSMMAGELGLDAGLAKRAGLFHDIGKSVDGEYEGSHARAGAGVLKRRGEDPLVVNAVAAHHEEVAAESIYAGLVMVADTISAVRPGARAESLGSYLQRLERLEALAGGIEGVLSAYAIQAGREIRVIVQPETVDDGGAGRIARELRQRIESELQYPSTIKVTVIRERRFTETAT